MGSLEIATFQEDALANHFIVTLPVTTNVGIVDTEQASVRVLDIDLPDKVIGTYKITKKGKKTTRPSGIRDTTNSFTFNYRIDKNFTIYKQINTWMEFIQNTVTGVNALDGGVLTGGISTYRAIVLVQAALPNADGGITPIDGVQWTFTGCWPSQHGAVTFDENSGDPLIGNVTMQFTDFLMPNNIF